MRSRRGRSCKNLAFGSGVAERRDSFRCDGRASQVDHAERGQCGEDRCHVVADAGASLEIQLFEVHQAPQFFETDRGNAGSIEPQVAEVRQCCEGIETRLGETDRP